jgi:S1-C subfamily serine protease
VHIGATAFLGIQVQPAASAGISSPGVLIAGIVPGGPAASAGLSAGDVITSIDGRAMTSPASVTSYLLTRKPGAKVTIGYVDASGASNSVSVTLGSGPAQ